MRVVPVGTATAEQERTMQDLEELFSVPIDPAFGPIVPMYTRNFPHMAPGMKKGRGPDKKPRKKPEGSTPLQRAQRDRQSTLFIVTGAVCSLHNNIARMRPELFTNQENLALIEIAKALNNWFEATREPDRWQKVKQNLAASVDQVEKKV